MAQKDTQHPTNGKISGHYASDIPPGSTVHVVSVDENGLRAMLLQAKKSEGLIADLAAKLGVSAQHLGHVLAGRKIIGPKIQRAMGVVRTYQMFDVEIVMDGGIDE